MEKRELRSLGVVSPLSARIQEGQARLDACAISRPELRLHVVGETIGDGLCFPPCNFATAPCEPGSCVEIGHGSDSVYAPAYG